ncbi:MAG: N-acetylglucosamine-6-phosphate deacetylase [Traorella sp.]
MGLLLKHAHLIADENNEYMDIDIYIEDGKIQEIGRLEKDCEIIDVQNHLVIPGMIDIHIHGSMGYDFTMGNQEVINEVSKDLVKDGVTGYLGSLTVVSHSKMMDILNHMAHVTQPKGAIFHGLHAEGPYISMEYKAVMNPMYIRDYDSKEMNDMVSVKKNLIKTMTYSPSRPNADELLKVGLENNIQMMVGHTNASCECALKAIEKGASGFTHLYNAMSPHTHRNTGTVTAAFLSNGYCELIADTIHVQKEVLQMTYQCIGSSRLILVTDAMNAKSLKDGLYQFSDLMIEKKDGKAYVPETGRLAGSVACLNECVRNMREITHASYPSLVEMACVNPAKLLKLKNKGRLLVGYDADIAIMDDDFNCLMTLVNGEIVYENRHS